MNDFKEYLNRYCESRHITPEEGETHKIVQEVKLHYEKVQRKED